MNWTVFIGFEVAVMGGLVLLLLLARDGLRHVEREDEESRGEEIEGDVLAGARSERIFCTSDANQPSPRPVADVNIAIEALSRLEAYVAAEREQADEFVARPSVARLYENSERNLFLS